MSSTAEAIVWDWDSFKVRNFSNWILGSVGKSEVVVAFVLKIRGDWAIYSSEFGGKIEKQFRWFRQITQCLLVLLFLDGFKRCCLRFFGVRFILLDNLLLICFRFLRDDSWWFSFVFVIEKNLFTRRWINVPACLGTVGNSDIIVESWKKKLW